MVMSRVHLPRPNRPQTPATLMNSKSCPFFGQGLLLLEPNTWDGRPCDSGCPNWTVGVAVASEKKTINDGMSVES